MRLSNGIPVCAVAFALLVASSVFAQPPSQKNRKAPGGFLRRVPVISALDKNKDGEISAEEIENAAAALKTLDRDGNGKLTEDELRPNFGGGDARGASRTRGGQAHRRGAGGDRGFDFVERIMRNDKNGDGKVTKEEAPEPMRQFFGRIDANGDGVLEKAEVEAMAERFRSRGGRGFRSRKGQGRPQRPAREKEEGKPQDKGAKDGNQQASRRSKSDPKKTGEPVRLRANGLKLGTPLPDVDVFDESGDVFRFASLKGQYTVVVFGCLT